VLLIFNETIMTDQELKDLVASLAIKSDRLDAQIAELRASQKETGEQQKKTDKQIAELRASQKETGKQIKETSEQQKKTDEQMKKTDEQMKKTDERLNRLSKRYGDSERNKGEEVEDFFYRHFLKNKKIADISFDDVERGKISSDGYEHDVVMVNGNSAALVSVKYKLRERDIDYLIETELPSLRNFFRRLGSKHNLYGGVASYIVTKEVQDYATKKGLFVFTRAGKDVKLNNKDQVKALTF
jgi:hypothetical protein